LCWWESHSGHAAIHEDHEALKIAKKIFPAGLRVLRELRGFVMSSWQMAI
jgi:hypothetical protein